MKTGICFRKSDGDSSKKPKLRKYDSPSRQNLSSRFLCEKIEDRVRRYKTMSSNAVSFWIQADPNVM